jgi:serine/threonine protein kinase
MFQNSFVENDTLYIIMDYIDSNILDHLIKRHSNGLPHPQFFDIFIQILNAIIYFHNRKIIQSFITPINISLTKQFKIKICNFDCSE